MVHWGETARTAIGFMEVLHLYRSPFVLSERVGVDNFIVINQEDMTPLSENASIESETPRYFQVDNLYRIDAAKSLS